MYKKLLIKLSSLGIKYFSSYLGQLKKDMTQSNLEIVFELYVGKMVLYSIIAFFAALFGVSIFLVIFGIPLVFSLLIGFFSGVMAFISGIVFFHLYPYQKLVNQRGSIEANMPFAVNHMAAVASAGAPPYAMFDLLQHVKEYEEISNEASRVTRNTSVFGMDITTAIKEVADRTPSRPFREFLYGIVATIQSGGDLKKYLSNAAEKSLFDYRIRREKYLSSLSTYADFYTTVLIAAPLFFVSILSIMSMIGGTVFGMDIPTAMRMGIWVIIPVVNMAFLLFVHFTQPRV